MRNYHLLKKWSHILYYNTTIYIPWMHKRSQIYGPKHGRIITSRNPKQITFYQPYCRLQWCEIETTLRCHLAWTHHTSISAKPESLGSAYAQILFNTSKQPSTEIRTSNQSTITKQTNRQSRVLHHPLPPLEGKKNSSAIGKSLHRSHTKSPTTNAPHAKLKHLTKPQQREARDRSAATRPGMIDPEA